uniref:Uncharacterized protein n=1 Tax=Caenorhabditis japonica TaxID=281687 RepID=A0A8R1HWN6_CAEJA
MPIRQVKQPEKNTFIGYFKDESSVEYKNLQRVAQSYRDECEFMIGIGELNFPGEVGDIPKLVFQPSNKATNPAQIPFSGDFQSYEYLKQWVSDKCVPLVREITFQNAEELTEEGLPFMILFKRSDDNISDKVFADAITREIPDQRKAINCLVGDGVIFKHPLSHLGKTENDLPVIAIDSFRHMYLFKNFDDIGIPGKLRQFVLDLHSGKLHREFHHGPDPVPQIRSARIRSGTNPHCARIRYRPNTKCPNRKCYESELVLIVTARINNARISNGTNPKWYESETPDSEVVRI